ncbi:Lrp/AsnC family transcriptional regulator [Sphingomonas sp.]|uniref:Lrp/AsnC family transcriptional regulator n=1 Tax=Sphingomonas sp. TaxID=28214 RepID=UPI00289702E1|nr:Lrp/AsnC family transcriptional regulator [Sphingomonas sp.]
MDRVDLELLAALEAHGRQSFATLGDASGLSKTSSWARVQAMERAGVITGYRAVLEPSALGLPLSAYVSVIIDPTRRDAFERAVTDNPAIVECSTVAGEADYLLKIVCTDVGALDEMLRSGISLLPGLQRSSTTICLKTLKSGGSLVAAARELKGVAGGGRGMGGQ